MKLFGFEIKRNTDNKAARIAMPSWGAGFLHATPENYQAMTKAYKSWVYVCANKNALSVAQQTLRLYVAKPDKKAKTLQRTRQLSNSRIKYLKSLHTISRLKAVKTADSIEEVLNHPFLDLLQNVNPYTNQFDLWELSTVFQELVGNAYWFIIKDELFGIPEEIWVLPAQNMTVVPGKEKFIAGYVYSNGAQEIPFEPDEIVHFKYANPNDMHYGMSPLSAVTDAYNTNQNILKFTNSLFTNMARPEGVLTTEQALQAPDFERLKIQWNDAYGGVSKARKTAVLTKGLQYKPITMTPQELDYTEGRKVVKEEICNAYGQSLGMYDKDSTRANSEQADVSFLRDTIQPRLRRNEEKINEQLMPLYDEQLFVAYDSPIPEDKEFRLKERESNIKSGYSSINMERRKDSQEEVVWGDIPILATNMAPLGSTPPVETPAKADSTKFAIRQVMDKIRQQGEKR